MCSIFGALGSIRDEIEMMKTFDRLRSNAGDRGRDGGRFERYYLDRGWVALLGNWRATPTPEIEKASFQPYDGVVHNGTIANSKELGEEPGEVDSMILPRILDRSSLTGFVKSLERIKGSYALAVETRKTVFLACNYKPLYYWMDQNGVVFFASMERHFEGVVSDWERPKKLTPYSAMDLRTGEIQHLPRIYQKRAIVIASAGLDSTVVATKLVREEWNVHLLHFKYGCKAEGQESRRVEKIAQALGCTFSFMPIDYRFAHSTILDGKDEEIGGAVEGSEYAIDYVPARNLVMLSLATAFAEANGYHAIALGNNIEESGSYGDNEEEFTNLFHQLLPNATQNGYRIDCISPVGTLTKFEIVTEGLRLQAPLSHTWSCYRAGETPCHHCGPCFMREEAFRRNGVKDPVALDTWDSDFWRGCIPYDVDNERD